MLTDRFDQILWVTFLLLIVALGATSAYSLRSTVSDAGEADRNLERKIAERARVSYLEELYAPMTADIQNGRLPNALLALEEIQRSMPDEAYGQVLKGVVLTKMGAIDAAVASFVAGIKRNGDYIDRNGTLSQRKIVTTLVEGQLPIYAKRVASNSNDTSAVLTKRSLHYLQSRLAGGCE